MGVETAFCVLAINLYLRTREGWVSMLFHIHHHQSLFHMRQCHASVS